MGHAESEGDVTKSRPVLARTLFFLSLCLEQLGIWLGGWLQPGYSHLSQYISELNAAGTAYGAVIGLYLFLPLGVVMTACLLAARPMIQLNGASRAGFYLLYSYPAIIILGVIFPCDAGCPVEGSLSQFLHNALTTAGYLMTAAGIALLSRAPVLSLRHRSFRPLLVVLGVGWLAGFLLMATPELSEWRGAIQRAIEWSFFAVLAIIIWVLPEQKD